MATHYLLLVLVALFAMSVSADVFVSIDCGSSDDSYTDKDSIKWIGDGRIQNGVAAAVQSNYSTSPVMDTLRVFPNDGKKNCYSIDAEKGGKVLIRASFYYGNYDNKSSPPTFELLLDGNPWSTVHTSSDLIIFAEAIYVVRGDVLSVCVAKTLPDMFPFISALEVRSLGSQMYGLVDSGHTLYVKDMIAFGADASVRYPDDTYGRIWSTSTIVDGLIKVSSDATVIDVNVDDEPPKAVLKNAIATPNTSVYITLSTGLSNSKVPMYVSMYFSEVTRLDSTQKRSFHVLKNNLTLTDDPVVPPYGTVLELSFGNFTSYSSDTTFTLVATSDSTLPPLINAMEIFYVGDRLTGGTDSNDGSIKGNPDMCSPGKSCQTTDTPSSSETPTTTSPGVSPPKSSKNPTITSSDVNPKSPPTPTITSFSFSKKMKSNKLLVILGATIPLFVLKHM